MWRRAAHTQVNPPTPKVARGLAGGMAAVDDGVVRPSFSVYVGRFDIVRCATRDVGAINAPNDVGNTTPLVECVRNTASFLVGLGPPHMIRVNNREGGKHVVNDSLGGGV
jgi:hypothetical protein